MNIYKNFISKQDSNKICNVFLNNSFPWYYHKNSTKNDSNFFSHGFIVEEQINSGFIFLIEPILKKLKCKKIYNIRANLCLKGSYQCNWHTDNFTNNLSHKTAIYYVNSNNGRTIFKKNKKSVYCKANRLVLFDGRLPHCSVTSTNAKKRIVINLNFFNKQLED